MMIYINYVASRDLTRLKVVIKNPFKAHKRYLNLHRLFYHQKENLRKYSGIKKLYFNSIHRKGHNRLLCILLLKKLH